MMIGVAIDIYQDVVTTYSIYPDATSRVDIYQDTVTTYTIYQDAAS